MFLCNVAVNADQLHRKFQQLLNVTHLLIQRRPTTNSKILLQTTYKLTIIKCNLIYHLLPALLEMTK